MRVQLTPPPRATPAGKPAPGTGAGRDGRGSGPGAGGPGRRRWLLGLAAALVILIAGAIGSARLLWPAAGSDGLVSIPSIGDESQTSAPERAGSTAADAGSDPDPLRDSGLPPAAPSPRELREQAYLRDAAGEGLAQVSSLRRQLEEQGVEIWAADEFARAGAAMAEADEALTAGRYGEARDGYARSLQILESVQARAGQVRDEAMAEGEAALQAGRMTEAAAAFALAARIAPDDGRAVSGLRSAESFDEVLALLNKGEDLERAGELAGAETAYLRAAGVDPGSRPAQEALARVRLRRQGDAMSAALSEGLTALEDGRFEEARAAIDRAGRIDVDSPLVAEARARIDERETLQRIAGHRQQAVGLERAERWRDAETEYAAALALDGALSFAQEGQARSRRRAEMQEAMSAYIAQPGRLADEEVAREAAAVLAEARQAQPAGPGHAGQIDELSRLLNLMSRSLPVILESDGKTEVTVYRVGRLGAFERHELQLRPGTYTVVGQRQGYRDVRHTLTVSPGEPPAPLMVRCQERL